MTSAVSNRDLLLQREQEAAAYVADLIARLEESGERVAVSSERFHRDVADRDALVLEAHAAGLSLEYIGQLSGIEGGAPNVHRARERHRRRLAARSGSGH